MAMDERKAAVRGHRAERKAELLAALGNPWEDHLWQQTVLPFLQEHGYTLEQVLCTLTLTLILTLTLTGVRARTRTQILSPTRIHNLSPIPSPNPSPNPDPNTDPEPESGP